MSNLRQNRRHRQPIDEEKERKIWEAARARALREGKLKGGGHSPIPIKAAGELAGGLLKGIPIVFEKTPAGWMPLAELVDIVDIISVTGEPGQRCIKLKIRANEAGRAWAGMP